MALVNKSNEEVRAYIRNQMDEMTQGVPVPEMANGDQLKKAMDEIESGIEPDPAEAFRPKGIVRTEKRDFAANPVVTKLNENSISYRNFHLQREMLVQAKRKRESEIDSLKAEMRDLTSKHDKVQRELFVIQAKEEAIRAAIRSMEDRGVHE